MKTEKINHLIADPGALAPEDLPQLRQLVEDHPWCSAFQVLLAKAMKSEGDPAFQQQLKKTAIYSADRKVLYRLIMQPGLQASIAAFDKLASQDDGTVTSGPEEKVSTDDPAESTAKTKDGPEDENKAVGEGTEGDLLDTQNLELEVLSQVAAQAYQLEFENDKTGEDTSAAGSERDEKATSEMDDPQRKKAPQAPLTFIDFISGGGASADADEADVSEAEDERLIDRFIQNEPKIERKQADFFSPVNMGKMSLIENEEMVTETLAGIYARQGETEKARRAYEQLALKYPEKSSYFAGLIKKMGASKTKK